MSTGGAQFDWFGKNKLQTRDYQFQNYETDHFKILFYPGGEALAEFATRSGEEFYGITARDLGIELEGKTPLILYLSPGQFSETNVILDVIEEGVGGFSEIVKNRIAIPFNGSYSDFHHVIGHELAHIFEFELFYRSRLSALLGAVSEFSIPLWVLEGFAEYQSGWVNVSSESFMRDLLINDRLVSLEDLAGNTGYLSYREGESFFRYVADRYGKKKVYEFLHALNNKRNIDAAFASTFGMSVKRLGSEWKDWLRIRYWPQVVRLQDFGRVAKRLTDHVRDGSVYNTAPALSPGGTKIAMISDRGDYADVYVISANDGRVIRRLVKGQRSGGFENMHLIRPGVSWSPDESEVAVVVTSAGRDNISLVTYPAGRVRRRIYGGLDAVYSPRYAPSGNRLVFVGVKNGYSDIYSVGIVSGEPERLTYDIYEDRDPAFSPGGDSVVFVSDRPDPGDRWAPGSYALWLRTGSGELKRLSERSGHISHPEFTNDGDFLLYVAADSADNVCVLSLASGRVIRRTGFLGDASYLTLSRDSRKLAFAYYSNVGWDIAVMVDPLQSIPEVTDREARADVDTLTFDKSGLDFAKVKPVRFNLSLDYAAAEASYGSGPSAGLSGALYLGFSDILGNHRFDVYTDLYGDILNSDLIIQYWLLPGRIDYGFSLFQLFDIPYYDPQTRPGTTFEVLTRLNRGGQAIASYPFDRFVRVEAGLANYWSDVEHDIWRGDGWYIDSSWTERVTYVEAAFVHDNVFWAWFGPLRGTRARLGADASFVSDREFSHIYLDLRNYTRLGPRTALATQVLGIRGFGLDADSFYIGGVRFLEYAPGQLTVRGYNPGEFYSDRGPGAGFLSLELRYPFIDRLRIAFPLPLSIGGIRGVAFADGAMIQRPGLKLWDIEQRRLNDLKVGVGVGARVELSYFLLKFDIAKPLSSTTDPSWKFIFGLGAGF